MCMATSVVASSTGPVFFDLSGAAQSPFLFTAMWQGIAGLTLGAIILVFRPRLLLSPGVRSDIAAMIPTWSMAVSVAAACGYALFALSLVFLDASTASVLYAGRTMLLILVMAALFSRSGRYLALTWGLLGLVVLAVSGVVLVILGQTDTPAPLADIGHALLNHETFGGVVLVLLCALAIAAGRGCTLRLAVLLAARHPCQDNPRLQEVLFSTVVTSGCLVVAGITLGCIGLVLSETLSWGQVFYAASGAMCSSVIGATALKAANLLTRNLGLNAMACATPLITLLWFWMLGELDVPHPGHLLAGAIAIAVANLFINAKSGLVVQTPDVGPRDASSRAVPTRAVRARKGTRQRKGKSG